jgi:hypothetical protein
MLLLLQQYALTTTSHELHEAFCGDHFDFGKVKLMLHDHVRIASDGVFDGFEEFSVFANGSCGNPKSQLRPRYDVVQITIPRDAGGNIAASRDLLRVGDGDTALAQVLGIISLEYAGYTTCLLHVAFLCNASMGQQLRESQKYLRKTILKQFNVHYGYIRKQWQALYPIVTLKSPTLAIADVNHKA